MERNKLEDPAVELAALNASLLEKVNSAHCLPLNHSRPGSWACEKSVESVYRDNKDLIERIHEVSIENLHLRSVIEMFLSDNYTDFFEHFEECCKQAKNAIGKP